MTYDLWLCLVLVLMFAVVIWQNMRLRDRLKQMDAQLERLADQIRSGQRLFR